MKNFRHVLRRHFFTEFENNDAYALCNSLVGSQFILIKSSIPVWALLSRFKQYLIHLF